jgi:archaellum biogenesis protein FlaJ (TadC family)
MKPKIILVGVKILMVIAIIVFVFTPMDTPVEISLCLLCVAVASACLLVIMNSDDKALRFWRKKPDESEVKE